MAEHRAFFGWAALTLGLCAAGSAAAHPPAGRVLPLDFAKALVGKKPPPWMVERWDGASTTTLKSLRGRVVFVRFWTDTCPFCQASLPAVQSLAKTFSQDPVTFIGLYHAKPRGRDEAWEAAVKRARGWGARFALAFDRDWRTLRAWYLERYGSVPTSVSFILDPEGRVVMVHPGPVFHSSSEPEHARCQADYQAIERAIRAALPPR